MHRRPSLFHFDEVCCRQLWVAVEAAAETSAIVGTATSFAVSSSAGIAAGATTGMVIMLVYAVDLLGNNGHLTQGFIDLMGKLYTKCCPASCYASEEETASLTLA